MSNNKQSSVEWFASESLKLKGKLENKEITIRDYATRHFNLLNKAKAMHKSEVTEAFHIGRYEYNNFDSNSTEYYNETFGGNNEQQ